MKKNKGGGDVRNHRAHDVPGAPRLKDLGIEKKQSMRWQQKALGKKNCGHDVHGCPKPWLIW